MTNNGGMEPPGGLDWRFREVMDAAPVMIWVAGPDKLCTWFNRRWLEFTGRAMAQELGHGWTEGIHPDDFARCFETYVVHFDARKPFRMQYRLRRHDGQWRWIDDIGAPHVSREGEFLGYVGSCVDIHDQKLVEIELRQLKDALETRLGHAARELDKETVARSHSERELLRLSAQLAVLVQSIRDCAIFMLDREGRVVSWNCGAALIKGYSADEVIGQHFACFYTEEDRQAGVPTRALQQAERDGRFESEGWRVRKDGSRFWANALINAIHDRDGRLIGFAKVTRDMTEKRQAEALIEEARARLLQMQKMEAIGQLTGGVAHDFNNLLTIIIGNLDIARRTVEAANTAPARLRQALDNALLGASRAATLTQRLLAFSRRQPLDPRPVDVNCLIAGETEFLQRTLGESIQVEAVGGAGLWRVEADAGQLETALLNLAVNARDAMPEGGKLTIETSNAFLDEDYCKANPEVTPGQYVLIAVSDSGVGMSREVIERAFEPFFSTKTAGHGTGLGLSQVYGFIKQSGGHVKIYSEPGEGTTVKIYLPRLVGGAPSMPEEREAEDLPAGEPSETILVVEDDEDVRAYIVRALTELNYRVLWAGDYASAIAQLKRSDVTIDLLLTDVVLPGRNGREVAAEAQNIRPRLKVLFMTGYSRNAVVHQGRLDPGVELIQKPITQQQLAGRVRSVLDRG